MAYMMANSAALEPREVQYFPCVGGLDLSSSKLRTYPGSLQDCMNYEVSYESGYSAVDGTIKYFGPTTYFPKSLHILKYTGGNVNVDTGAEYRDINTGNYVKVFYVDFDQDLVWVDILDGVIQNEYNLQTLPINAPVPLLTTQEEQIVVSGGQDLYVTNEPYASFTYVEEVVYSFKDTLKQIYQGVNGPYSASKQLPGTGPIAGLFELKDRIYMIRQSESDSSGSSLWRAPNNRKLPHSYNWEKVYLGHEVYFFDGTTEPKSGIFNTEFEDPSSESTGALSPVKVTRMGISYEPMGGPKVSTDAWKRSDESPLTGTQNVGTFLDNDSEHFECVMRSYTNETMLQYASGIIFSDFKAEVGPLSLISGIQFRLRCDKTVATGTTADVHIANVGIRYNGVNYYRKYNTSVTTTAAWYEFGGDTDAWRATERGDAPLSRQSVEDEEFSIIIQPGMSNASGGSFGPIASLRLYQLTMEVTYADGTTKLFFYDSVDGDVASARCVHLFKTDGNWDTNDAKGVITLYDIEGLENISSEMEIRNAPLGGGDLIGKTVQPPATTRLPLYRDMKNNQSILQTLKTNFYSSDDRISIYGATGASPAFTFNGKYFVYIRTLPTEKNDRPRHIAEHSSHLVLGYDTGQILISAPGNPVNYSGLALASERSYGDPIRGMLSLNGNALAIFGDTTSNILVGSSVASFTDNILSKFSGGIEYTQSFSVFPVVCDTNGVSTIETTQNYGDFNIGKISDAVASKLHPRLKQQGTANSSFPFAAFPNKSKNQYKLLFRDGEIMTTSFKQEEGSIAPMVTWSNLFIDYPKDVVPSAIMNTTLSNRRELTMIGTEQGDIWIMDATPFTMVATIEDIYPVSRYLEFNPISTGTGFYNMKFSEISVFGKSSVPPELTFSCGVNYFDAENDTKKETTIFGFVDNSRSPEESPAKATVYMPSLTEGMSVKIESNAIVPTYSIQSLGIKAKLSSDRANNPRSF